jgi:hypothetical protein
MINILLGVTGHESAVLAGDLCASLQSLGHVRAVVTQDSKHFLKELPTNAIEDNQEWYQWRKVRMAVHVEVQQLASSAAVPG